MEPVNVTGDSESFTSNAWLVAGEENVLVDAGTADADATVEEIRRHVDDLDAVALTHQHGDHVGSLTAVLDEFSCRLYAYGDHPRLDVDLMDGGTLKIGGEECTVVHTPGHAEDHVAFVGDTRVYTGDVCVYSDEAYGDGSYGRTDMPGQSREELIDSLRVFLRELPPSAEEMYPGHGPSYTGDVHAVVERALERAERREPKYD